MAKWKLPLPGSRRIETDAGQSVAMVVNHPTAAQIVREHNAHDEMVRVLRNIASLYAKAETPTRNAFPHEESLRVASKQAQIALDATEGKSK